MMRDLPGLAALALVALGLAATIRAQVRPLRRGRALLDALALVPEWRFYAQASMRGAADLARDPQLVVRDRDADGRAGGWRPVWWFAERRLRHALWNPSTRVEEAVLSMAEDLAEACAHRPPPLVQQSLRYLVLLRAAMAADPPAERGGAAARQFAVVHAVGRGRRDVSIAFLSAWHRW